MIKKITLPALLVLFSFCLKAQFVENQFFFKLKNVDAEIELDFSNKRLTANNNEAAFRKLTEIYDIKSIASPFITRDQKLQQTFLLELDQTSSPQKRKAQQEGIIKFLEQQEFIEYVERVPLFEMSVVPNDPNFSSQWHLDKINAQNAWDISLGSNEVVVAIIDDAVRLDHEDLQSAIFINPNEIAGNGIDDDNNGYIDDVNGWDAANFDNDPSPPSNNLFTHGTHVAGIASAVTNNNIGVASIGYGTKIMPVKTKRDASTGPTLSATFQGLDYAINCGYVDVVNMSFGSSRYSRTFQNLINAGREKGIVFVAAAGNSNTSAPHYPAAYNNVIGVGASTQSDRKAFFSNYGSYIDVMAPGTNILSTVANSTSSYRNLQGTSMASPLVAGLCGLMLSYSKGLSPEEIESCLKSSSDDIDDLNTSYTGQLGSGRINAEQALECLKQPPIADFSSDVTFACTGQTIQFTDESSGVAATTWLWTFTGGTPSSSTEQNPSVVYSSEGTYSVSLTVTNAEGSDAITKTDFITVGKPTATLSGSNTIINGSTVNLRVDFTGNSPYSFTYADGSNNSPINNITSNPYFFSVRPIETTTYRLVSIEDSGCDGDVEGEAEIIVIESGAGSLDCQTLILQPDASTGKDARIFDFEPNENFGNQTWIRTAAHTNDGTPTKHRSLIDFDLSSIPSGATVTSAYLSVYQNDAIEPNFDDRAKEFEILRITESWNEQTVTWNNQPATTDVNKVVVQDNMNSPEDYPDMDVTELIKDMVANPNRGHGFMLQLTSEINYQNLWFGSSETADASVRPKLVIDYCVEDDCEKINNVWAFGKNVVMDFNNDPPILSNNSLMDAFFEGCASISDESGNLLFYSNGQELYRVNNGIHSEVPNGNNLRGNRSSTQAALFVKNPQLDNIFYLFTAGFKYSGSDGVRVSTINTSLDGGMGDMVINPTASYETPKNQLLENTKSEKLAAVRNSTDSIWVLLNDFEASQYYAHLVNADGVSLNPVISSSINTVADGQIGQMKFSPDATKIAVAFFNEDLSSNVVEVGDFNFLNGTISNNKLYTVPSGIYGIEFSPNGKYLYCSILRTSGSRILQINLSTNDIIIIHSDNNTQHEYASLQLAPNGKIYVANDTVYNPTPNFEIGGNSLSVINRPNNNGLACDFQLNAISLPSGTSMRRGLPNIVARVINCEEDNCINLSLLQKISDTQGNFDGNLSNRDGFGLNPNDIGDFDGDGINELAVSARLDDDGGTNKGAMFILFMNSDGTVKTHQKISENSGGFTGSFDISGDFGADIIPIGDLNNDGVTDLAVGENRSNDGGLRKGAVWILFMNRNGTVKSHQKISDLAGGFTGTLVNDGRFGVGLAYLGDINGDNIGDIAVGSPSSNSFSSVSGKVFILFLNRDGTVKSHQEISSLQGGLNGALDAGDDFGSGLASIGDINGDGINDLAVGAKEEDGGNENSGGVFILELSSSGTVLDNHVINGSTEGFTNVLSSDDLFGVGIGALGDIDNNGISDLVVGAPGTDIGKEDGGAFYIIFLNKDFTVKDYERFDASSNIFSGLIDVEDKLGWTLSVFDFNNDGEKELAVATNSDDDGGTDRGAFYILSIENLCDTIECPNSETYNQEICIGDTLSFSAGEGNNYVWLPNTNISDNTVQNPRFYPIENTIYTVSYVNADGCSLMDTLNIIVNSNLSVEASPDSAIICPNDTIQLLAIGAENYQWTPTSNLNNSSIANPIVALSITSQYKVVGSNSNGCKDSAYVYIEVLDCCGGVADFFASDTTICIGDSVLFTNTSITSGAVTYSWAFENGNPAVFDGETPPYIIFSTPGAHEVILIIEDDCGIDTAQMEIFVNDVPQFNIIGDTIVCPVNDFTLELGDDPVFGFEYIWTPSLDLDDSTSSNPIATIEEGVTYTVRVVDLFTGCEDERMLTISVDPECTCEYVVPNAFSPNGDGRNDDFEIKSQNISELYIKIFSRWGELVFESNAIDFKWDGRFRDKELSTDVFGYYLEIVCGDTEERIIKKGNITLLR